MHLLLTLMGSEAKTKRGLAAILAASCIAMSIAPPHVHTNASSVTPNVFWARDPVFGKNGVVELPKTGNLLTFQGFVRPDGKLLARTQFYTVEKFGPIPTANLYYLLGTNGNIEGTQTFAPGESIVGLQSTGKVITARDIGANRTLHRYNASLLPDLDFAPPTMMSGGRVFIQSDDKILMARDDSSSSIPSISLTRLTSDGHPDTDFMTKTITNAVTLQIAGFDPAGRLVILADDCKTNVFATSGSYLGTIKSTCADGRDFWPYPNGSFIWLSHKFDPSSSLQLFRSSGNQGLDPNFGVNGHVTLTLSNGLYFGNGTLIAQPDEKITLAVGLYTVNPYTYPYTLIARFHADGSPDLEFGAKGYLFIPWALYFPEPALFVTQDQKLVIAGYQYGASDLDGIGTFTRLAPFTLRSRIYLPTVPSR